MIVFNPTGTNAKIMFKPAVNLLSYYSIKDLKSDKMK